MPVVNPRASVHIEPGDTRPSKAARPLRSMISISSCGAKGQRVAPLQLLRMGAAKLTRHKPFHCAQYMSIITLEIWWPF